MSGSQGCNLRFICRILILNIPIFLWLITHWIKEFAKRIYVKKTPNYCSAKSMFFQHLIIISSIYTSVCERYDTKLLCLHLNALVYLYNGIQMPYGLFKAWLRFSYKYWTAITTIFPMFHYIFSLHYFYLIICFHTFTCLLDLKRMDLPNSLSPLVPIVHSSQQIFQITSLTEICCYWSANTGTSMRRSPLKIVTFEFVLASQFPACFVRPTWMVFEMHGRWLYSCFFMGCCFRDWLVIVFSLFVLFVSMYPYQIQTVGTEFYSLLKAFKLAQTLWEYRVYELILEQLNEHLYEKNSVNFLVTSSKVRICKQNIVLNLHSAQSQN